MVDCPSPANLHKTRLKSKSEISNFLFELCYIPKTLQKINTINRKRNSLFLNKIKGVIFEIAEDGTVNDADFGYAFLTDRILVMLLVKSIPPPRRGDTFQEFTTRENYPPSPLNLMSNFNNYGSKFI